MTPEQLHSNDNRGNAPVDQAERCRRLARATYDRSTAELLEQMAADYEQRASQNDC